MIHIITTGGTIEGLDYEIQEGKIQEKRVSIEIFSGQRMFHFPIRLKMF